MEAEERITMRVQEDLTLTDIVTEFEMNEHWQQKLTDTVVSIVEIGVDSYKEELRGKIEGRFNNLDKELIDNTIEKQASLGELSHVLSLLTDTNPEVKVKIDKTIPNVFPD